MKAISVGVVLFFVSVTSNAGTVSTAFFSIDKVRISESSNRAYIDPMGDVEIKNSTCPINTYYAFDNDTGTFDELYATALAASISNRQIRVWVSDVANDCVAGTAQRVRSIEVD